MNQRTKKALKNKSKRTGISYRILKQVYNRGYRAWRTGHRPGVAPTQWALGRVNSFITGKGKARVVDKDLSKKAGLRISNKKIKKQKKV